MEIQYIRSETHLRPAIFLPEANLQLRRRR